MSADQSDESVKNKELELIPKWFTQAIALVLILAAGMLVAYVGEFGISLSGRQDVWGQFGDFFGGVLNPILSFMALIAVLTSLKSQSFELKAAREEAVTAQNIQKKQTDIFEQQSRLIERQSFESAFFMLMDMRIKTIESLTTMLDGSTGYHVLNRYAESYNADRLEYSNSSADEALQRYRANLIVFSRHAERELTVYFNLLEEIFDYIESFREKTMLLKLVAVTLDMGRDETENLKRRYASIVVAMLSGYELECIFMYIQTEKGKGLKKFVEKYGVLKGLPKRLAYDIFPIKDVVGEGAFR